MPLLYDFKIPSLTRLYSNTYDENMLEWRRLGALDKAANITHLIQRSARDKVINSVLEVGCGTGAVLQIIAETGVGRRFVGIDIDGDRSASAHPAHRQLDFTIHAYDGVCVPYPDEHFDFVYATHVLEHVVNERSFLHELRRVAKHLIYVEVPCELHARTSFRSLQATLNIGHINSYTPASFVLTLATSGLKPIEMELFDHSFAVHVFRSSAPKALIKIAVRRVFLALNRSMASRFFTYHCGALCEKGLLIDG